MTKGRRKIDSGQRQMSLLDVIEQLGAKARAEEAAGVGALSIEGALRRALSDAIKKSDRSIHQIAGEMSHLTGDTITADMIYSWTAESKTQHQIWGSRIPAFCRATGDSRPLEIIVEATGRFCVPGPDVLLAERQRVNEQIKKLHAEGRRIDALRGELERRR